LTRLDTLSQNAHHILELIDYAKKGAAALIVLQTRLHNRQAVRCTTQNVKATAAARYGPPRDGFALNIVPIEVFVNLVTYLPLADLKTIAKYPDALDKATGILEKRGLDSKWGTYYTYLMTNNQLWAKHYFDG
jgi:hypothetical protein